MKALITKIVIIYGIILVFSIGMSLAHPNTNLDTLQFKIKKLENANQGNELKIKEIENNLVLHKSLIDNFDMVLTKETFIFASIVSLGLIIAASISVGGYFLQVRSIRDDLKSEMGKLENKIEEQIDESKNSLLESKIYSEGQWGDLAVVTARSETDYHGKIYFFLKSCHHYCNKDLYLKDSGVENISLGIILDNLAAAKTTIEMAQAENISQEEFIGNKSMENWEAIFNSISSYENIEVRNGIAEIRTLILN